MSSSVPSVELLSIKDAAARGISRIRRPNWRLKTDYLKLDLHDGSHGPWIHLFSEINQETNGRNPYSMLCIQLDCTAKEFEAYAGEVSSDEAK